ncbi:hypothetical protein BSG1_15303 [Bacillus sp. SG-1]|nr:hypothetical protein BSG1_15303 [Bacillus sp. SG-1]
MSVQQDPYPPTWKKTASAEQQPFIVYLFSATTVDFMNKKKDRLSSIYSARVLGSQSFFV